MLSLDLNIISITEMRKILAVELSSERKPMTTKN